jgi:hypothetical protein
VDQLECQRLVWSRPLQVDHTHHEPIPDPHAGRRTAFDLSPIVCDPALRVRLVLRSIDGAVGGVRMRWRAVYRRRCELA